MLQLSWYYIEEKNKLFFNSLKKLLKFLIKTFQEG